MREGSLKREPRWIEMRENAFGIGVAFAAENFAAVDSKAVEKILFFGRGFLDETGEPGFDRIEFSGVHFEIRMQADKVRERAHARNVCLVDKRVEQSGVTTFADAVISHSSLITNHFPNWLPLSRFS
jgi:hypothetical protein